MPNEELQLDLEIAILKETIKQQQQEIHNLQMRVKELVEADNNSWQEGYNLGHREANMV